MRPGPSGVFSFRVDTGSNELLGILAFFALIASAESSRRRDFLGKESVSFPSTVPIRRRSGVVWKGPVRFRAADGRRTFAQLVGCPVRFSTDCCCSILSDRKLPPNDTAGLCRQMAGFQALRTIRLSALLSRYPSINRTPDSVDQPEDAMTQFIQTTLRI